MDPDPVCPERLDPDPDPVCPERLDPDPVNIKPDPKPMLYLPKYIVKARYSKSQANYAFF